MKKFIRVEYGPGTLEITAAQHRYNDPFAIDISTENTRLRGVIGLIFKYDKITYKEFID